MASEEDKDKKGGTSETPGQKLVSVPGSSAASSPSTANGTGPRRRRSSPTWRTG